MENNKSTESTSRQAQDLAYKAMSTRDPEEAVRLCTRAIEIDPRCVDALVIMAGVFDDLDERARHLSRAVAVAEEDLGGKSYLEDNKGHFWGLLDTRPYMRARSYLAQTLHESGRTEAAVAEYEALLELNPNDNQGLRYVLIGLYLERDDVDGARRLRDEYEDDASAVFAWSDVLERLISGDTANAELSLDEARNTNQYVEGYLLGRKAMPGILPDHYGFGDENEAIVCMDVMGDAWKKHPEAMRWLRLHESPATQTAAKAKVGRNDLCPCGSGKKYKKCCMGREDAPSPAVGSPIAAEKALRDMRQAMGDREFSSAEELDAFIQEYNQQRNQRPIDDFEGLSSEQMHRLINFPFESPEVVEFPSLVSVPPSAPIATLFGMLVNAIGEDGLKPTATSNLPLKLVQDAALAFWGEDRYQERTRHGSIRCEHDFYGLHVTRIVAGIAGLIRKYKGKLILSSKCRNLLKYGGMQAAYPLLLRTHAERFNWGYQDMYSETGLVQNFFGYTLYLLDRYGSEWRENTFYEDAFLRAFPVVVDNVEPTTCQTQEDIVRGMYSLRCLRRFAEFLGLIEIEPDSEDRLGRVFRLRKTPLLDDAVRFGLTRCSHAAEADTAASPAANDDGEAVGPGGRGGRDGAELQAG